MRAGFRESTIEHLQNLGTVLVVPSAWAVRVFVNHVQFNFPDLSRALRLMPAEKEQRASGERLVCVKYTAVILAYVVSGERETCGFTSLKRARVIK